MDAIKLKKILLSLASLCIFIKFWNPFSKALTFDQFSTYYYSIDFSQITTDSHLPLYYLVVHFFLKIPGINEIVALKLPSYLASVFLYAFTLKKVYQYKFENKYIGFFLIFNILSFEWAMFRLARMYEIYYVLAVILAYYFDELKDNNPNIIRKLSLTSFIAGCTHFMLIPLITSYVFIHTYRFKGLKTKYAFWIIIFTLLPATIFYLIPDKLNHSILVNSWQREYSLNSILHFGHFVLGGMLPLYWSELNTSVIVILYLLILITMIWLLIKKKVRLIQILLSIPVLYIMQSLIINNIVNLTRSRYLIALIPAFIFSAVNLFKPKLKFFIIVFTLLLVNNIFFMRYFEQNKSETESLLFFKELKTKADEIKLICGKERILNVYIRLNKLNMDTCLNPNIIKAVKNKKYSKIYVFRYIKNQEKEKFSETLEKAGYTKKEDPIHYKFWESTDLYLRTR